MLKKELGRIKRHNRLRKKVIGTPERPRVSVHRSLKNLYVQAIDDTAQKTLASCSTQCEPVIKAGAKSGGNLKAAHQLGLAFGAILKEKGLGKVSFDRGGYLYHGRVKALADALREVGIQV